MYTPAVATSALLVRIRENEYTHSADTWGSTVYHDSFFHIYLYFAIHFQVVQVFFISVFYFYILSIYTFYCIMIR